MTDTPVIAPDAPSAPIPRRGQRTTCAACYHRSATHDALCGPCTVAAQIAVLGQNEGRLYEAQPHTVNGVITYWEVYERSREGRRFHCTLAEWPASAAYRRMGPVAAQEPTSGTEGGEPR